MAAEAGPPPHHVSWLDTLSKAATQFDFHMVMRRLECIYRENPRFGEALRPSDEPVRLGQEPSMAFAPSMLTSFRPPQDGLPGKLVIAFFGMFGPRGPLPVHITEYTRDRLRNSGDRTLASFIDMFHHRMMLLFHRAWSQAHPMAAMDRPRSNRFSLYVGALFGLALPSMFGQDVIPDEAMLQYVGRLSAPAKNAEGLRAIVADYLGLPVAIEEFIGEWLDLPDDGRWRLGESRENGALGRSTVLGKRVWQCDHKFRVALGPLSREQFRRMLPGGASLEKLAALVRTYVGDEYNWDVRLVRKRGASDQLQLGGGGRLGYDSRLGPSHAGLRNEDLIVNPLLRQTRRQLSQVPA